MLCDEPVSNLDVSVQATILTLLADYRRASRSRTSSSHMIGVVRYLADRVGVMYLVRAWSRSAPSNMFSPRISSLYRDAPGAMPTLDGARTPIRAEGSMPSAAEIPPGCPFHTRCHASWRTVHDPGASWRRLRAARLSLLDSPDDLAELQKEVWQTKVCTHASPGAIKR